MEEGTTESVGEARPDSRPDSRPPWKIRQDESKAARRLAREKLRGKICQKLQWLSRKEGAKGATIAELQRLLGFESSAGIVEVLAEMDQDGEAHAVDGAWWEGPSPEPDSPSSSTGTSLDETKRKVMQIVSSVHRWWMPMEVMGAVTGATLADAKSAIDHLVRFGLLLREGGAGRICTPPAPAVHQVGPRPKAPTRKPKPQRSPPRLPLPRRASPDPEPRAPSPEPKEDPMVAEAVPSPVDPTEPVPAGVDLTKAESLSISEAHSLGRAVRAKRMALGLSQGRVGEMVQIGQSDVSRVERGDSFFGRTVRVLSAWADWTRPTEPPPPEPSPPPESDLVESDPAPPPTEPLVVPTEFELEPESDPSVPSLESGTTRASPLEPQASEMTATQLLDQLQIPAGTLRERTMWLEGFMVGAGRPVLVG